MPHKIGDTVEISVKHPTTMRNRKVIAHIKDIGTDPRFPNHNVVIYTYTFGLGGVEYQTVQYLPKES